jgi:hypothetical protein
LTSPFEHGLSVLLSTLLQWESPTTHPSTLGWFPFPGPSREGLLERASNPKDHLPLAARMTNVMARFVMRTIPKWDWHGLVQTSKLDMAMEQYLLFPYFQGMSTLLPAISVVTRVPRV